MVKNYIIILNHKFKYKFYINKLKLFYNYLYKFYINFILRKLNLSFNKFKYDNKFDLKEYYNINELNLICYRSKSNLSINGLETLIKLKYLNLAFSFIKTFNQISNLYNLKILYLNNNNISSLKYINKLINLETLDVSNNNITHLKNLNTFTKLKYLDLSNNKILKIEGLDNLLNLKHLDLSHNRILIIENINHLINLNYLYIYSFNNYYFYEIPNNIILINGCSTEYIYINIKLLNKVKYNIKLLYSVKIIQNYYRHYHLTKPWHPYCKKKLLNHFYNFEKDSNDYFIKFNHLPPS